MFPLPYMYLKNNVSFYLCLDSSAASFPGFPSSLPLLRFSRTASDGKLEGKPGNEATVSAHTLRMYHT